MCLKTQSVQETIAGMERNLERLNDTHFDLVVIGGGIYGAWIAFDASQRGLHVALIEQADFGHATSFNSLKIIHGGFRYLQHLDIPRMRKSIHERSVLLRIAPHLVRPIPFLMPTYGHGFQSKEIMRIALMLNDVIGFDRNRGVNSEHRLGSGYVVSRSTCLGLVPGLEKQGLTGAAIWHDCQLSSSERLMMSILRGATMNGAQIANYVKAIDLIKKRDAVIGVRVSDQITNQQFEILGRLIVNAAGPWTRMVHTWGDRKAPSLPLSKAINLVVRRPLVTRYAVGVSGRKGFHDSQSRFHKGNRLFFLVPAGRHTFIGTTHTPCADDADAFCVTEQDVEEFLHDINAAYAPAQLEWDDLAFVYAGLLPANLARANTPDVSLLKQHMIWDLEQQNGVKGFISVVGVKLTEARSVAEQVVTLAFQKIGRDAPKAKTALTVLDGGELENPEGFLSRELRNAPPDLSLDILRDLIARYGSSYSRVLSHMSPDPRDGIVPRDSMPATKAEVRHAVREEMAIRLADVVRRRTELGPYENPGDSTLVMCAEIMAAELGWSEARRQRELDDVRTSYSQQFWRNAMIRPLNDPRACLSASSAKSDVVGCER